MQVWGPYKGTYERTYKFKSTDKHTCNGASDFGSTYKGTYEGLHIQAHIQVWEHIRVHIWAFVCSFLLPRDPTSCLHLPHNLTHTCRWQKSYSPPHHNHHLILHLLEDGQTSVLLFLTKPPAGARIVSSCSGRLRALVPSPGKWRRTEGRGWSLGYI